MPTPPPPDDHADDDGRRENREGDPAPLGRFLRLRSSRSRGHRSRVHPGSRRGHASLNYVARRCRLRHGHCRDARRGLGRGRNRHRWASRHTGCRSCTCGTRLSRRARARADRRAAAAAARRQPCEAHHPDDHRGSRSRRSRRRPRRWRSYRIHHRRGTVPGEPFGVITQTG